MLVSPGVVVKDLVLLLLLLLLLLILLRVLDFTLAVTRCGTQHGRRHALCVSPAACTQSQDLGLMWGCSSAQNTANGRRSWVRRVITLLMSEGAVQVEQLQPVSSPLPAWYGSILMPGEPLWAATPSTPSHHAV
jgi:cell division protein FtsL